MQEVDDQALDVGAVAILVCHDHHLAVPELFAKAFQRVVHVARQVQDTDQVLDLFVFDDLVVFGFSHVEELALERKHTVHVVPNHTKPSHSKCFS